jgi:hypothetical protein
LQTVLIAYNSASYPLIANLHQAGSDDLPTDSHRLQVVLIQSLGDAQVHASFAPNKMTLGKQANLSSDRRAHRCSDGVAEFLDIRAVLRFDHNTYDGLRA